MNKKLMKRLFDDLVAGLVHQGYVVRGGGELFIIMDKEGRTIKLFADDYEKPNHIFVRYSACLEEEENAAMGISLCSYCYCMTKTINGKCGKCKQKKTKEVANG